jgi:hypothetical protein
MMKKLNFLFYIVIVFVIISCSSDDSNEQILLDPVVGIWKPTKNVNIYDDGTQEIDISTICEQQSRFTFFANGDFTVKNFEDKDDDCVEDSGFQNAVASWGKTSETIYKIIGTYTTNNQQTETFTEVYEIEFPNTNTMRLAYVDQLSYTEFNRIK